MAEYLAEILPVPVISLGAGNCAHGVHIISSDLFHLWEEHVPKHSRIYTDLIPIMEDVITRYMDDVSYMDDVVLALLTLAEHLINAIAVALHIIDVTFRKFGFEVNYGPGKT